MKTKKEIHVVYIITKLELGGAQKICLSLLNGINKSGHHAGLISGAQGALVTTVKKTETVFLLDSLKREIGPKIIFSELKTFFKMIKILRKLKKKYPNLIVHTHSSKAGVVGRWAAFFARVKKRIHTVHGFSFNDYQPKLLWLGAFLIELVTSLITTTFVCVSKKDLQEGIRLLPKFEKKSIIIRAAVDWDAFYLPAKKCSFEEKKSFIIGSTACFKPQKNILDLLKAFNLLRKKLTQKDVPIPKLQIIGDGVERKKIEGYITSHNLTSHIDLLGWQTDVASITKTWDLFTLSSLWEGLPCAVIEARLSKLPVVAYDVGGIFEIIFNDKNGYLIQPGDWQNLSFKLEKIILDPLLHKRMSQFPDSIDDFKKTNMIKNHINLYKKIL